MQPHVPYVVTIYYEQSSSWSRAVASNGLWHLDSGVQLKTSSQQIRHWPQLFGAEQARFQCRADSATITDRAAADQAEIAYRRLTRQWEAVVSEIRGIRAFSQFLLPPLYEGLQAAARQGPVIILIASQYSCSAIIVPHIRRPPSCSLTVCHSRRAYHLEDRFARAIRHALTMAQGAAERSNSSLADSMGHDHANPSSMSSSMV
ncbi:hypothetical protein BD769DRAFT_223297 [Suillus cothurnatus]|nr:hypothetical protein BD769DRAFT_223297 [Suillus cothurnatus]